MKTRQLTIKCFAKQTEGVWVAVCLDFYLAAQGESMEEVKNKLEEQIYNYVEEALLDKQYGDQLLNRRAPLSSWLEYYYIRATQRLFHRATSVFIEMMPLRLA